jgi:hypothetical protein
MIRRKPKEVKTKEYSGKKVLRVTPKTTKLLKQPVWQFWARPKQKYEISLTSPTDLLEHEEEHNDGHLSAHPETNNLESSQIYA